MYVEVHGFPFKKLIFESQESIQSYVDKGWNFPVGQMMDSTKKYPKITFFSTKINTNEHFYGTGEMFSSLDKLGQRIYLDICDTTTTDTERHYKAIPFYMPTNHYGVFINQSAPILFDFAASSYRGVTFQVLQDFLDFFVVYGPTMKDILDSYTGLTGKCEVLPPKWSFGLWMSRISYKSQQEVDDTIKAMRDHEVPFDVLHIDTDWFERGWECDFQFSKTRFPNPEQMIANAHSKGVKISLWQLPYIRNTLQLYQDGEKRRFLARPPKEPAHHLPDLSRVIEMSNPGAISWYKSLLQPLIRMGIDVIKADFGKSAYQDLEYAKHPGVEMHNLYPLLCCITKQYGN